MEEADSLIIIRNLKNKTIQRLGLNYDEISEILLNKNKSFLSSSYSMKNLSINQNLKLPVTNYTSSNNNIKQNTTNSINNKLNKLFTNKELKNQLIKLKDKTENNKKAKFKCEQILKKQIFIKPKYFKIQNNNSNKKLEDKFFLSQAQKIVKNLRNIFCCNLLPINHENKLRFNKEKSFIYQDLCYLEGRDDINSESSRNIIMPICSKNHNVINLGKPLQIIEGKYLGNKKENIIYNSYVKKSLIKSHSSLIKFNKLFKHSSNCKNKF